MNTEHPTPDGLPEDGLPEDGAANGAFYHCHGGAGTLSFRGTVDIFEARSVHAAALQALADAEASAVVLDFTAAERLDLSAWQIAAALRRDLAAAGRAVSVQMPDTLASAMTRMGFTL